MENKVTIISLKCKKCGSIQPISNMSKKIRKYGRIEYVYYKKCQNEFNRKGYEKNKQRNSKKDNKEIYNKNTTKYCPICQQNLKRIPENWIRQDGKRDGLTGLCRKCHYKTTKMNRYDLNEDLFNQMLKIQENKCYICEKEFNSRRVPCIDHDHKIEEETGEVRIRAILCHRCNLLLGILEKTIDDDILKKALDLIKKGNIEGVEKELKEK